MEDLEEVEESLSSDQVFDSLKKETLGTNFIIRSIDDANILHQRILRFRGKLLRLHFGNYLPQYRGEQCSSWILMPPAFRNTEHIKDVTTAKAYEKKAVEKFEQCLFDVFKRSGFKLGFYGGTFVKHWDMLMQASHAGVYTSLINWTPDIFQALYFATEKSSDRLIEKSDSQIWLFLSPISSMINDKVDPVRRTYYDLYPFDMWQSLVICPPSFFEDISRRLSSYRTFKHPMSFIIRSTKNCITPLNEKGAFDRTLIKAIIPAKKKNYIRKELLRLGISKEYLFLDHDKEFDLIAATINRRFFEPPTVSNEKL